MTVVLALAGTRCVTLAADSQATGGAGHTTGSVVRKVGDLHGRIAYGFAGSAGLRQRVIQNLTTCLTQGECGQDISALRPILHRAVNAVQQQAEAEWIKGTSREPNLIEALFAGVSDDGRPWIYEVTCNGGDEEHDLAEAIGAGRVYAMSALMALRHHGFEDLENRQVHVLAYRAINDAIATAAHEIGISGPIHMHIAEQRGALPLQDEAIKVIRYEMISQQQQEREIFRKPGGSLDKSESAGIDPPPAASRTMTT